MILISKLPEYEPAADESRARGLNFRIKLAFRRARYPEKGRGKWPVKFRRSETSIKVVCAGWI